MKWTPGYKSDNVEDRRGQGGGGGGLSLGGIGMLGWLFRMFGLPGLLIGGAIMYFGSGLLNGGGGSTSASTRGDQSATATQNGSDGSDFVGFVLDDVQKTWSTAFAAGNQRYQDASLVIFDGRTRSGCGTGAAEMGPFYCPNDQKVYIDLSFYRELKERFGAPGDFAQAYVIAHEVGHHVQHLLGLDRKVSQAARGEQTGADALSVRLELQADCLAGAWARASEKRDILDPGDIDEALKAAAAIGDDRLQKQSSGSVTPETWTHGSSAQRQRWFKRGYEQGTIESCDTFGASQL
jgi:predicted metalloprotease